MNDGFGKSMHWLVYKAKQLDLNKGLSDDRPPLATLGKAMNEAFFAVKKITGPITETEPETEAPDDESVDDNVWDLLLFIQNEISELKSRIDDLESENVDLKHQISNLKETKKDKWSVRYGRKH